MLGNFTCGRFRFVLQATKPLQLSAFAGATLRGGFGHVFKRTVCIWPPADCPRCLLKNTCSYPYIFETAPPPGATKLRGLDQIPRPFVIEPPAGTQRQFQAGERLEFRLVLIGRGIEYLPYFLFTFSELGKTGLGPGRGQYEILEVHAEGPRETKRIYNAAESKLHDAGMVVVGADLESGETPPGRLTIHFLTPTRIKSEGRMRPEINFQELIRALLRRVSSLCFFHCGRELEVDFKGLVEQAFRIKTRASDVGWQEQDRFSGRQKQRINMSGVVGTVIYEAAEPDSFAPFLPLLAAGEWVHVGKGCVMGLGKYRMEAE